MSSHCPTCGQRIKEKAAPVPLPDSLNTPEFQSAWSLWLGHLGQKKKPPTTHAQELQLKRLQALGPTEAIKTILHCIEKNWQGIYERSEINQGFGRPSPSEVRNASITGADSSGCKAETVIAQRNAAREAQRAAKAPGDALAAQVAGHGNNPF